MNTLAGWGFTTPAALARHFGMVPASLQRVERKRGGRHVSRAELEAFLAKLGREPLLLEIRAHFQCSRPSAYNYFRRIKAILDERGAP